MLKVTVAWMERRVPAVIAVLAAQPAISSIIAEAPAFRLAFQPHAAD